LAATAGNDELEMDGRSAGTSALKSLFKEASSGGCVKRAAVAAGAQPVAISAASWDNIDITWVQAQAL